MTDFLDRLAQHAKRTVDEGYYETKISAEAPSITLKETITKCRCAPIIVEIKTSSPSTGVIKENVDVEKVALAMEKGGAIGLSILTEPKQFMGSLDAFIKVRRRTNLPLLMKDVIISPMQLEAASKIGANTVLLIEALFERGYCERDIYSMISYAHSKNLEVLLETHTEEEFSFALDTDADLVGVNNRDLRTLKVDLDVTKRILGKTASHGKIVVSESGINTPSDIRMLHSYGAHAFLVGSAIMREENVQKKVEELAGSL